MSYVSIDLWTLARQLDGKNYNELSFEVQLIAFNMRETGYLTISESSVISSNHTRYNELLQKISDKIQKDIVNQDKDHSLFIMKLFDLVAVVKQNGDDAIPLTKGTVVERTEAMLKFLVED